MTDRELMQMALDVMEAAIKAGDWKVDGACDPDWVLNALRTALAQPEQEPVAWCYKTSTGDLFGFTTELDEEPASNLVPLYTAPPQREFIGLTDEEEIDCYRDAINHRDFYRAIEAKLREKNA